MADKGWIGPYAFENDALSANTLGRSAMADGFLTNAKIAESTITLAKMADSFLLAFAVTFRVDETKVGLSLVG